MIWSRFRSCPRSEQSLSPGVTLQSPGEARLLHPHSWLRPPQPLGSGDSSPLSPTACSSSPACLVGPRPACSEFHGSSSLPTGMRGNTNFIFTRENTRTMSFCWSHHGSEKRGDSDSYPPTADSHLTPGLSDHSASSSHEGMAICLCPRYSPCPTSWGSLLRFSRACRRP